MMRRTCTLALAAALLLPSPARAQIYQTDFPPEEFRARWQKVFEAIGKEAVAVVQGAPLASGFVVPRQSNTFYYLCGIETPGAYLVLDGRARRVTLFLPPRNERLERNEGKVLSAEDAEAVTKMVGVDAVQPTTAMVGDWPIGSERVAAIYAEFAPAEGWAESRYELETAAAAIAADYWDGRPPRHAQFLQLLRTRHPRVDVRDINPILDAMRIVKSPREVALVRRASQLAGLGILAAIRSTEPGVWEYQLDAAARYVFQVNGARLDAYRSITASGIENINNGHYWRNSRQVQDGDLVLMDYAPDYRYYVSDVTRMWPANGRFAPWQRELLQFVLEDRNAVLPRIRPGRTPDEILADVREAMAPVLARTKFSKPLYEAAARKLVETGGGVLSHPVGLTVHDVGSYRRGPLQVGTCSPSTRSCGCPRSSSTSATRTPSWSPRPASRTSPSSCRSNSTPSKRLVREKGIVQQLPPTPPERVK